MKLIFDFMHDFIEHYKSLLIKMGYVIESVPDDKIILNFYKVHGRLIPAQPREIFTSDVFYCSNELKTKLKNFEKKIKLGENLNIHQGRELKDSDYNDALFNDWKVHHFHLGTTIESDGFSCRTGDLLFAFVKEKAFFKINIYPHGAWSDLEILEIIHRNWPDILEPFKINDIQALSFAPSSKDIGVLRKKGINCFTQLNDGTVYCPPGWGMQCDGSSTTAVMKSLATCRKAKQLEDIMKKNEAKIIEEAYAVQIYSDITFKLMFDEEKRTIYAYNADNDFSVLLSREG